MGESGGGDETQEGEQRVSVPIPSELQQLDDRRSSVLDALPEIVYMLDDQGRLVDWNDQLEEVTGLDAEELAGKQGVALAAEGDDRALAECVATVLDGEEPRPREVALRTAGGDAVPHRLTSAPLRHDGDVVGIVGTASDISERLARERAFEEKNARLERFASILSHDLRNPLAVADGYLDLAQAETDAPYLDEIEAAHDRMHQLIEDLLTLARDGSEPEETTTVDLTGVATDAWTAVSTADASLTVGEDLGTVEGDRGRLRQLFENLFRNAVEHGSTSPRSQAREDAVEHGSTGSQNAKRSGDAVDHGGDAVRVSVGTTDDGFYVADDGPGIPEEAGDPFESGFTTKAEGTGLGLSIVASVAEAHGWTVDAGTSSDGGARFDVRF